MKPFLLLLMLVASSSAAAAQDMKQHDEPGHSSGVERRGDQAMGFPHDKTRHHFRLYKDGGAIEVTANHADDQANIGAIRKHLAHIAMKFSEGDFSAPMFIHNQPPPGTDVMSKLRSKITYRFEEMPSGGRIRISTDDRAARSAIHDFLKFQITDHHTGDPLTVAAQHRKD